MSKYILVPIIWCLLSSSLWSMDKIVNLIIDEIDAPKERLDPLNGLYRAEYKSRDMDSPVSLLMVNKPGSLIMIELDERNEYHNVIGYKTRLVGYPNSTMVFLLLQPWPTDDRILKLSATNQWIIRKVVKDGSSLLLEGIPLALFTKKAESAGVVFQVEGEQVRVAKGSGESAIKIFASFSIDEPIERIRFTKELDPAEKMPTTPPPSNPSP